MNKKYFFLFVLLFSYTLGVQAKKVNNQLEIGLRVLDVASQRYRGEVKGINEDGSYRIYFDGFFREENKRHEELSVGQFCMDGLRDVICENDYVIRGPKGKEQVGVVIELFENGIAFVKFDDRPIIDRVELVELSREVESEEPEFYPGAEVVDQQAKLGKYMREYSNGVVQIRFKSLYPNIQFRKKEDLGYKVSCFDKVCAQGKSVRSKDKGHIVEAVYSNGFGVVRVNGQGYQDIPVRPLSEVNVDLACLKTKSCSIAK